MFKFFASLMIAALAGVLFAFTSNGPLVAFATMMGFASAFAILIGLLCDAQRLSRH